jgi:hypothetical protein
VRHYGEFGFSLDTPWSFSLISYLYQKIYINFKRFWSFNIWEEVMKEHRKQCEKSVFGLFLEIMDFNSFVETQRGFLF